MPIPPAVLMFVPIAIVCGWLACDDDDPPEEVDEALTLERLPASVVREIPEVCSREQIQEFAQ